MIQKKQKNTHVNEMKRRWAQKGQRSRSSPTIITSIYKKTPIENE